MPAKIARNKELAMRMLLRGLRVSDLAAAAGVSRQTVSAILHQDLPHRPATLSAVNNALSQKVTP